MEWIVALVGIESGQCGLWIQKTVQLSSDESAGVVCDTDTGIVAQVVQYAMETHSSFEFAEFGQNCVARMLQGAEQRTVDNEMIDGREAPHYLCGTSNSLIFSTLAGLSW